MSPYPTGGFIFAFGLSLLGMIPFAAAQSSGRTVDEMLVECGQGNRSCMTDLEDDLVFLSSREDVCPPDSLSVTDAMNNVLDGIRSLRAKNPFYGSEASFAATKDVAMGSWPCPK